MCIERYMKIPLLVKTSMVFMADCELPLPPVIENKTKIAILSTTKMNIFIFKK
jgi:hypothetical protein